ncbi:uncharacterized protein LTR77_003645 [Saxophila tyrrhenica]|uniref:CHRD domain-containing protein n=1 Tax=Saxophila tyrrhenica TaxID=1690608 RepID=A0AAV9PED0_9PEZI|nr:hypothetical protein LTR77_003645 [Saxophila tyrrhenica]
MKISATIAAVALLATSAFASPVAEADYGRGGHGGRKHGGGRAGKGRWCEESGKPVQFSSTYSVVATPDQVVNGTEFTGGLPGAIGYYEFGLNRRKNIVCYDIRIYGFRGEYESAADTATHMHEAPRGESGPPRLAFPNPKKTGNGDERRSQGCLYGPFETGIIDEETGMDTGAGFKVGQIENDPDAFFCDAHSSLAVPGAIRGQLE